MTTENIFQKECETLCVLGSSQRMHWRKKVMTSLMNGAGGTGQLT
jgi:hypothetical protein